MPDSCIYRNNTMSCILCLLYFIIDCKVHITDILQSRKHKILAHHNTYFRIISVHFSPFYFDLQVATSVINTCKYICITFVIFLKYSCIIVESSLVLLMRHEMQVYASLSQEWKLCCLKLVEAVGLKNRNIVTLDQLPLSELKHKFIINERHNEPVLAYMPR